MNNAIKVITDAPLTKQTQAQFAGQVVTAILDGEVNPLDVDIYLKAFEESIALIRKDERVKRAVQDEAEKYPEKTFEYHGIEVTRSTRTTYDYATSKDSVWVELKDRELEVKGELKKREALLKAIPRNGMIVSALTGEVIMAPEPKSQNIISIKFK